MMGLRRLTAALGLVTLVACSSSPKGELMLSVQTDLKTPGDFDIMRIEVRQRGVVLHAVDYSLTAFTLPGTLGLLQGESNAPVDVRVIARKGPQPLIVVDLRTTVPSGRIATLPVTLDAACVGRLATDASGAIRSLCGDGTTCQKGLCVPIDVDPNKLPTYGTASLPPSSPLGIAPPLRMSSGEYHSCGITSGGGLRCWGENGDGQLGDGTTSSTNAPVDVQTLASGVVGVYAGVGRTCAIVQNGGLKCWGRNGFGQLGDGTATNHGAPTDVVGISSGAAQVYGSFDSTCALMQTGTVKCWGDNASGQLGNGTTVASLTPVDVQGLSDVRAIGMNGASACALLGNGGVKCWGSNTSGQLGDGTQIDRSTPVDVLGLGAKIRAVVAGKAHACALTEAGAMLCWGSNAYGQLGDGTTTDRLVPTPIAALGSDVAAVSAGWIYTCAIVRNGALKCWGWNLHGNLANGTTSDSAVPTDALTLGPGSGITALSTGYKNTCVFTTLGKLRCCGYNASGAVGDGTNVERVDPVDVVGL